MPEAVHRLAGGEEWAAIAAPRELPQLETWLPYLSRGTEQGRAAYQSVRELERLALQARRAGNLQESALLRNQAEQLTVASLERNPEPAVLQNALYSIDFWIGRVPSSIPLERNSSIAAALNEVTASRVAAAAMLERGDTAAALLEIMSASERIRQHTPEAVAIRVLANAESRIAPEMIGHAAAARALHLLGSARQELISGDPVRALNRALYALQIMEGSEVRVVKSGPDHICAGQEC
ncbi:hypothetical protein BH23GEM6_BH23GEM6_10840 [soil metagenome]